MAAAVAAGGEAAAAALAAAKKRAASRSWILFDAAGEERELDADKYAIMHRVDINARDLRILDPLLSYPSTILGRERAIVLNLEHIKAIVTSEEVLLRDPSDENVIPVVEELRRRLAPSIAAQHDGKDNLSGQHDVEAAEEDESPFEFRAPEVTLEAICSFLDARTTELETDAYPALDELTSKQHMEGETAEDKELPWPESHAGVDSIIDLGRHRTPSTTQRDLHGPPVMESNPADLG